MSQPPINPFESPRVETAEIKQDSVANPIPLSVLWQFIPLAVWTVVIVVLSLILTPSDPVSVMLALWLNMILFWGTFAAGSVKHLGWRYFYLIVFALPAASLVFLDLAWSGLAMVALNFVLSIWAAAMIKKRRFAIVACFSVCFLLGSIFNIFTVFVGGLVGAIGGILGNIDLTQKPAEEFEDS